MALPSSPALSPEYHEPDFAELESQDEQELLNLDLILDEVEEKESNIQTAIDKLETEHQQVKQHLMIKSAEIFMPCTKVKNKITVNATEEALGLMKSLDKSVG